MTHARSRTWLTILSRTMLLVAVVVNVLAAQREIDWSRRPVLLITMGQGDEVFEKFGHNAIAVWDDAAGQPLAYNWGMFDFDQPNFLGRFLTGDTKYWMQPFTMAQTLDQYQRLNRTVTVQEIQLTPTQKAKLVALLADNAREENKFYRYDYYRDNCSTRARDAIDAVTGGAIKRAMTAQPGQGSYRWHTRRLLAYSDPLYFGAEMVLGVDADAPLSGWQEAFLPQSLSESFRRIELPAAEGLPARPLVLPIDTLFRAPRDAEPRAVSLKLGMSFVIGVLLALVLAGLGRLGRVGAFVAMAGWSLTAAILGSMLLLAWFATQHMFMANNPTVALLNPVWLVGIVAAVMVLRGGVSRGMRSVLRWLLVVAVIGTAGAVLLGHAGSALELALLVLPSHAAVAYLADRNRRAEPMGARA
ncbi:MAG: DUF4105 domain-containing protein [Gemmatimonadaceae bacterium]|nr:DUF4105 domain-containing protein [Gemmatimonadaceae bacterium]